MNVLTELLKANLDAVMAAPVAFLLTLVAASLVAYRASAWYQAGEARNLKAENKKLKDEARDCEHASKPSCGTGASHELYLRRQDIHWPSYNDSVEKRFWAAGTSLVGVVERGLVEKYISKGIRDVFVILPSTEPDTLAHHQLYQFDLQPKVRLVHNQVATASESFRKLSQRLSDLGHENEIAKYLRQYMGVIYANITIFDDDAFFSPYTTNGVGDSNLMIHFNSRTSPNGYRLVEEEFLRMWNAAPQIGVLPKKKQGCSMIFINSLGRVLLYKRDQKADIAFPGQWDLLGGHVEAGELPEQCIVRELQEEIEYRVSQPILFRVFDMPDRIEYTYWCKEDLDVLKTPLHEGHNLRWFSEEEIFALPSNQVAYGFREVLGSFFRDVEHIRRWFLPD